MNLFEYYASKLFLTIFGWLFSLAPLDRHKVVFASARDSKPTGNLLALINAYRKAYPQGHYVQLFRPYSYGLKGKLSYLLSLVTTTYHLKTARYFFIDNALFPVHVIKHRRSTVVIQVWHATGILKKFGLDTTARERKVVNTFLHKGYDFVLADSEKTREGYHTAFHIPRQQILLTGSPRTDILLQPDAQEKSRARITEKFPALAGKIVVLYAPTFRGFNEGRTAPSFFDARLAKELLGDEYALMFKPHTAFGEAGTDTAGFDAVLSPFDDIADYLPGVDGVITDYSSILFEAALVRKPLYKLCPDLEQYLQENDFYIDYRTEVPGAICLSTPDVADALLTRGSLTTLSEEETAEYLSFIKKYCTYNDGHALQRVLERFPL